MKKTPLSLACILLAGTLQIHAQTLVEWNTAFYDTNPSVDPNPPQLTDWAVVADKVTASEFILSGVALGAGSESGFAANAFALHNWSTSSSLNSSELNVAPHVSFTLQAASGYQLAISSISYTTTESFFSADPTQGFWGYRIDGGVWQTQTPFNLLNPDAANSFTASNIPTWNVSINTAGTVEFGFWAYGASGADGTVQLMTYSDFGGSPTLSVNGAVQAVPEPSTYMLIGLAAFGFALIRRYKISVS